MFNDGLGDLAVQGVQRARDLIGLRGVLGVEGLEGLRSPGIRDSRIAAIIATCANTDVT